MEKRTAIGGFLRAPTQSGARDESAPAAPFDPTVEASIDPTVEARADSPVEPRADAAHVGNAPTLLDALEKRCPKCGRGFPGIAETCGSDGARLVAATRLIGDPFVGAMIRDRYSIEGILGKGGMGTVYEVLHVGLEKRFAMKILRPEIAFDKSTVERFIQEARLAASVKHENLADVSDFGEISSDDVPSVQGRRVPFFVMELLRGETLGELLRDQRRIDGAFAVSVFRQVALGLAAAHEHEIVHRDLKPDNIFLMEETEPLGRPRDKKKTERRVKVLDFGVAKVVSEARKLTKPDVVFGTPAYMSPEQASARPLDGRTDIYSLGVVMYEALTGRVPFIGDDEMGVMTKHQFEAPAPIERMFPDDERLAALSPIVNRCLEKDRDARYASALEVVAALEGHAVARARSPRLALQDTAGTGSQTPPKQRASDRPPKPARTGIGVPLAVFAVGSFVALSFVAYLRHAGPFAERSPAPSAPPPAEEATADGSGLASPQPASTGALASAVAREPTRPALPGRPIVREPPRPPHDAESASKVVPTW